MYEFRFDMLWGLAAIVASWVIASVIVKVLVHQTYSNTDTDEEKIQVIKANGFVNRALIVIGTILICLWMISVVWTGYKSRPTHENPVGEIEVKVGELYTTTHQEEQEAVRKEGREIQEKGAQELDEFRKDFFEKRGNE